MTKTILDLCRELPTSEAELRARADEFNEAVYLLLGSPEGKHDRVLPDYIGSIAAAKAAADALIGRGFRIRIECTKGLWNVWLYWPLDSSDPKKVMWLAASTEEAARSACALLAANAMRGE